MTRTTEKIRSNPLAPAFIVASLVIIYFASQFPDGGQVGPGFFPILICVGIIVFAVADLLVDDETKLDFGEHDLKSAGVVAVLILAYVGVMPITGFLAGTMAFLPVILYYSGVESKAVILLISVLLPVSLFYVFGRIFLVRLPEGAIPFSRLLPRLPLEVMF